MLAPLRPLGSTGINISVISLGTVKFGRNQSVKYPSGFQLPTDNDITTLLEKAQQLGINMLDTAPAYGTSEERLGNYFKKMGNRKDWIITTKFGETFVNNSSTFNFSKDAALKSVEASLQHLKTDYIDILLVHSNGDDVDIINKFGVFDTLSDLKRSGKIRAFGMSTKTVEGGILAVEQSDVVMVTFNPIEIQEQAVIAHAHRLHKGVLIKKALASGHLDKLSQNENPVKKSIEFILQEPGVSSIVIGTLNSPHLYEAVKYAQP